MAGLDDACDFLHPPKKAPGRQLAEPSISTHVSAQQPPMSMPTHSLSEILDGCTWPCSETNGTAVLRARFREAIAAGYSQRAVAVALGISHVTVGRLLKSPLGSAGN
jgi:hypothetical protein